MDVPGSLGVFVGVPANRDEFKRRHIDAVLESAPPTRYDWEAWDEAVRLGVDAERLLAAVVRRATRAPSDKVIRAAASFLTERTGDDGAPALRQMLLNDLDAPKMPRLLRALAYTAQEHSPLADAVAEVGIALLERSSEAPHWPATWHAMYSRSGRSHQPLDALARGWLIRHPGNPAWVSVAHTLAARERPKGRADFRQVLRKPDGDRDGGMCKAAATYLVRHPDAQPWTYLATGLLAVDPSTEHRDIARVETMACAGPGAMVGKPADVATDERWES